MNKNSLDVELPSILVSFKKNIEQTMKPFVAVKANLENDLSLWQSKFGGFPYLPKNFQYPMDSKGQPMFLLAQLNFVETPDLENFPKSGILQFYISSGNDVYGICFEDLAKQDDFRVLYFPNVIDDESKLITSFSFLPEFDMLPMQKPCSLTFNLEYAPISVVDYQFESKVLGQNVPESKEELHKIYGEYDKVFQSIGHKIGGYPYFTQHDPRHSNKYKDESYILLFQMDTDNETGIMWGDCGVGNFFIRLQDLQKQDFSRILYIWDCC